LEENLINIERVKLAGTVAIDRLPNVGDKFSQLCVVVVRDHRARRSPLRLAGHQCEATQESSPAAARLVTVCRAGTGRVARLPRAVRHGKTFCVHREPPG
jgi:hypothetical protein